MCGFIAQLVEHRTGIAEVMGSNPVEALNFFRLLLSNCLNWKKKIYCDDHTSLSNMNYFIYISHKNYPVRTFQSGLTCYIIFADISLLLRTVFCLKPDSNSHPFPLRTEDSTSVHLPLENNDNGVYDLL